MVLLMLPHRLTTVVFLYSVLLVITCMLGTKTPQDFLPQNFSTHLHLKFNTLFLEYVISNIVIVKKLYIHFLLISYKIMLILCIVIKYNNKITLYYTVNGNYTDTSFFYFYLYYCIICNSSTIFGVNDQYGMLFNVNHRKNQNDNSFLNFFCFFFLPNQYAFLFFYGTQDQFNSIVILRFLISHILQMGIR